MPSSGKLVKVQGMGVKKNKTVLGFFVQARDPATNKTIGTFTASGKSRFKALGY